MYDKIWLAGLGAYGRSEKLGKEGVKLFDELVDEGSEVRDRASEKLEDIKHKAKEKIQSNIGKIKEMLAIAPDDSDIKALSLQVEELSAAVNALAMKPAAPTTKKVAGTRK
ncbi:phasin family protein [Endozoicomonas sp. Mp262]|uniref:phasin family protein n=1 Tax=Endozoicomonas sp. Mp262 TaxID=2919499 RepID=UPI0021D9430C